MPRVELVLGHLVAGLRGPFDLVVFNPPYVPPDEWETLPPEIRNFEPYEAVVGTGQTDAIARRAREILRPGGWLVLNPPMQLGRAPRLRRSGARVRGRRGPPRPGRGGSAPSKAGSRDER